MYSLILATALTTGSATPATWWGYGHSYYSWGYPAYYGYTWGYPYYGWGYPAYYGWGWRYPAYYGWGWGYPAYYGWNWGYPAYGYGGNYYLWSGYARSATPSSPASETAVARKATDPRRIPSADNSMLLVKAGAGAETAHVTLALPEGARLFVNGAPFEMTTATRTFATPPLDPGRPYHYVFTAEMLRDGQTVRDRQAVTVEAGKDVTVSFRGLAVVQEVRR